MEKLKPILYPFIALSALGLVLSLVVHILSLVGLPNPLGESAWLLHVGIFVVWFPAVFVSQRLARDFPQKDLWKATLRGAPKWMQWMVYFFLGYAMLNFVVFMFLLGDGQTGGEGTPNSMFRGFSGHWMAFYSAALAILYSALHAEERDKGRRCVNGHPVSPLAKYCEECGQAVVELPS